MSKREQRRVFECPVVNETVQIQLRRRSSRGFTNVEGYFVQCAEHECQYASENKPPCPLNTDMFAEEIAGIEDKKRQDER